ncbi:response regulator transcription factor [Kineococcus sp. NPDC059986]|uniref:response regulator transcription factor n=1 Tax=Kineococcus sp. NPDC059986 TaxID=3155538 RepID=UPI0034501B1C
MIRLLVAEDMHIVRSALVALLDGEDDLEVVASVARGDEVLDALASTAVDVAVLDLEMPGGDGVSVAARIRREVPGTKVVILTALGRPAAVRSALAAGVDGFVLKNAPVEELVDGIRRVASGGRVLHPELAAAAVQRGDSPLTPRESDVLTLVAEGCTVRETAHRLSLSEGTVRNYLSVVVDKLHARSRTDAVNIAQGNGWI